MTRFSLVLLLALLGSALYLVGVQYESRRLFSSLDKARTEARHIEAENERLQVEKRAQATPLRVETLAKDKLHMRSVTPAITHYVTYHAESANEAGVAKAVSPLPVRVQTAGAAP